MEKNNFFLKHFKKTEQVKLSHYFSTIEKNIDLNKKDLKKLVNDLEKGILYYHNHHRTVDYILKILPLDELINGYQDSNNWYSLDTSSKIYPLSMKEEWMSIYRVSYYLKDKIIPEILQLAIDYSINRFPIFKTTIRKGFFWNYLDNINKHFDITKEENIPCSRINISKFGTQSFRVIYYENRISCEFFHVLTDAKGGIVFLTTLVAEYLRLLGNRIVYDDLALDIRSNVSEDEIINAFSRYPLKEEKGSLVDSKALEIDGKMSIIRPCQVINFNLSYSKLHFLAKEKNVTINELLLSFLFLVISYSTSRNGDIKIQVPVNMRKFYPNKTLRNFSLYNTISIRKNDIKDFESLLLMVKKQSREKLKKEKLDAIMSNACKLVKSLNFVPLFVKRPIASFIYSHFGDKSSTTVLSNLGKISLNDSIKPFILKADFLLGTTISNRALFSCITINEITTFSITKFTLNSSIENSLYNIFKEYNLIIDIHGSDQYEIKK